MTRKRRRLYILLACGIGLGTATALVLFAFSDSLVFFVTPSNLAANATPGRTVRLGGLVQAGSLHREMDHGTPEARFVVTDGTASVTVSYDGILPDLFREGSGMVALGTLQPNGTFRASEVLAKHDETYMPRDVEEALKRSGHWNPANGAPPPAATWDTARQGTRQGS
ncbi:MAG TPA: cytochrome c maturation protein CcmE [Acidisphaera sp.]|nr:cytochrome c maturation protein CcmE [Acidisphaera sp.]